MKQFQIPLWNLKRMLKREQHNSLHASAWYPICQIPERPFPLAGLVVLRRQSLHTLSSQLGSSGKDAAVASGRGVV